MRESLRRLIDQVDRRLPPQPRAQLPQSAEEKLQRLALFLHHCGVVVNYELGPVSPITCQDAQKRVAKLKAIFKQAGIPVDWPQMEDAE
jgi:hypothetical protein